MQEGLWRLREGRLKIFISRRNGNELARTGDLSCARGTRPAHRRTGGGAIDRETERDCAHVQDQEVHLRSYVL